MTRPGANLISYLRAELVAANKRADEAEARVDNLQAALLFIEKAAEADARTLASWTVRGGEWLALSVREAAARWATAEDYEYGKRRPHTTIATSTTWTRTP
jgi:hypothetical protein